MTLSDTILLLYTFWYSYWYSDKYLFYYVMIPVPMMIWSLLFGCANHLYDAMMIMLLHSDYMLLFCSIDAICCDDAYIDTKWSFSDVQWCAVVLYSWWCRWWWFLPFCRVSWKCCCCRLCSDTGTLLEHFHYSDTFLLSTVFRRNAHWYLWKLLFCSMLTVLPVIDIIFSHKLLCWYWWWPVFSDWCFDDVICCWSDLLMIHSWHCYSVSDTRLPWYAGCWLYDTS